MKDFPKRGMELEKKIGQMKVIKLEQRVQIKHERPSHKVQFRKSVKRVKQNIETPQTNSPKQSNSSARNSITEFMKISEYLDDDKDFDNDLYWNKIGENQAFRLNLDENGEMSAPNLPANDMSMQEALNDFESMRTNKGFQCYAVFHEKNLNNTYNELGKLILTL